MNSGSAIGISRDGFNSPPISERRMSSDFDWREYLELAKALVGIQSAGYSQEATERTAVSRAYYAAFGWARNYAESELGFVAQSGSEDHRRLREHFRRQGMMRLALDQNRLRA
jgi:hypothetical protein